MIDIHYHLIFGVDDGPETIDESVALAEASIAEGVTHVVATPHANERYTFEPAVNQERLALLRQHLDGRLTLGLGCDFHLSYENVQDFHRHPARYTINGKRYLLVEFPDYGIPQRITETFLGMTAAGVVPILTHPERNPTLQADPHRMIDWMRAGCIVQITAASLRGRFGPKAESMSFDLVKKHWVHVVSSDAHSVSSRSPSMERAFATLRDKFDEETAERLCIANPKAIFDGGPLPPQPDAVGVDEKRGHKRGFLNKVFGK